MLTPRKRISKKELKEDKLLTYYAKAQNWVEDNYKIVAGVAAVVLLVIVGSIFITSNREKSEGVASVKLAKAIQAFDSSDYTTAINILSDVVENNGSTKSGAVARFYLAQSLFRTEEYVGAEDHFKTAAKKLSKDVHLKTAALAGAAASLEQQGEFFQAGKKFEQIVAKNSDAPQAAYYLLRAARCYEKADDETKALTLYKTVVEDYPNSTEKNDALLLIARN